MKAKKEKAPAKKGVLVVLSETHQSHVSCVAKRLNIDEASVIKIFVAEAITARTEADLMRQRL